MRQVSKQPANASKTHRPAGVGKSRFRPAFKVGDIVMKAFFDDGVPFSNGVYTAVITKAAPSGKSNQKTTHHVQFVKQLAVEDPAELEAHNYQKQKTRFGAQPFASKHKI